MSDGDAVVIVAAADAGGGEAAEDTRSYGMDRETGRYETGDETDGCAEHYRTTTP
jgi:hypothetical protein